MAVLPPGDDLRLRLAAAEREVGLHSAVFRMTPVPLVVVTGDGVVRGLNDAAARACGTSLGSATGRPVKDLLGPANREALDAAFGALRTSETGGPHPVHVSGRDAVLVAAPLDVPHADGFALLALLDLAVDEPAPVSPSARRVRRAREAP
jgi:PAS domain-containing protein